MADKQQTRKQKTKKHLAREQREAKQTRVILIITIAIGAIIVGLVLYGLIDQLIIRPRIPVAKVDDTTIRLKEFQKQVQYQRVQAINQAYQFYTYYEQFGEYGQSFLETAQSIAFGLTEPVQFGQDVLNGMINSQIIRDEAEKRGISVSEEEIEAEIQAAYNFFPNGTLTPTTTATILSTPTLSETQRAIITDTPTPTATGLVEDSEEDAEADTEETTIPTPTVIEGTEKVDLLPPTQTPVPTLTLSPTPYSTELFGESLNDFESYYEIYNFNLDDLRVVIEDQLLREKLIEDVTKDMNPIEEQVWARHILVETEEEALEILEKLEEGQDFGELAKEFSIDDGNKDLGGDLNWFGRDTMVEEFTESVFNLEVGEISEPVETDFGYHIIQNLGYRDYQIPPSRFASNRQSAFTEWLNDLRETMEADGDVVIFEGWEDKVPGTPEVPQQFLLTLLQQQQ
jgi:parvulin-like peptidyl-prolyl isomerase